MKSNTIAHPLPLVVSIENQIAIRRLLVVLALAPAFLLLLTLSARAQEGVATSEWQRIHDGLKAAHPMPDPTNALPSESSTASGGLVQSDLKTLEETGIPSAVPGLVSTLGHIAGHPGIAPRSVDGHPDVPFRQESPERSSLVGRVRGSTNTLVTAPQPYLTPYSFPFSTQLRLLARFNVDGADYYYTCSASQASDFHLLTAAHCIYSHDPKGDGSGAGAGFAAEIWAWSAGTDVVDPIDPDNWPDFPYGIAKVTFQSTYNSWIRNRDLNWDVAFLTLDRRLGDPTGWMGREWGYYCHFVELRGLSV